MRGHIEQDTAHIPGRTQRGALGGLVLSVLVLLVIIICAGAYIAVTQIKSLKSEISNLEKRLAPLKGQVALTGPQEQKGGSEQNSRRVTTPRADRHENPNDSKLTASALVLSPDEIRLVRDYIKLAPSAGVAAPSIKVGDSVTTGTIPFPSSLVEKVPKLAGARFMIRNGAIIILKRDSRQADAVLGPN